MKVARPRFCLAIGRCLISEDGHPNSIDGPAKEPMNRSDERTMLLVAVMVPLSILELWLLFTSQPRIPGVPYWVVDVAAYIIVLLILAIVARALRGPRN